MTGLTVVPTDVINSHPRPLSGIHLFVETYVLLVKTIFIELNRCIPVTVDAPAHSQIIHLYDAVHLFHRAMTFLAFPFPGIHMLGMAEKHMVG